MIAEFPLLSRILLFGKISNQIQETQCITGYFLEVHECFNYNIYHPMAFLQHV